MKGGREGGRDGKEGGMDGKEGVSEEGWREVGRQDSAAIDPRAADISWTWVLGFHCFLISFASSS